MADADGNKVFLEALERARKIAKQLAETGKRGAPDEDGGNASGTPAKRFSSGPPGAGGINGNAPAFIPAPGVPTQEEWTVPNRMVGLIIGKGGENITRIQETCGAKLQLGQEPNGEKRSCIIYGTPAAIAKCKELVNEIIEKEGIRPHTLTSTPHAPSTITTEIDVPKHKVGQVIGKGGETIRMLQDKAGVRMFLIQDVPESCMTKPIKITGPPERVEHAKRLIEDLINTPDIGGDRSGQVQEQIRVPRGNVGIIIGKGGETIRDIQQETGARVQFIDNPQENDKTCLISGRHSQVMEAKRQIEELLHNTTQMNKQQPMGMGGRPQQRYECEEVYSVPANKTGVIIGKGGETIRQICERSGAKVELDRNHPQTAADRLFNMRGTRASVEVAKKLIEEKLNDQRNYETGAGSRDPWAPGGGAATANWMDPTAAASGDPSAAFWNAYCAQYYQTMGMPGMPMPAPGMPGAPMPPGAPQMMNPYMPMPPAPPVPGPPMSESAPAPPGPPGSDPSAASYYYQAAANPNQSIPASANAVQTTEDGQQDYSKAWVEYYRSMGMHKEADDLEATLKAKENGNH